MNRGTLHTVLKDGLYNEMSLEMQTAARLEMITWQWPVTERTGVCLAAGVDRPLYHIQGHFFVLHVSHRRLAMEGQSSRTDRRWVFCDGPRMTSPSFSL